MRVAVNVSVQAVRNRIELVVGNTGPAGEYSAEVIDVLLWDGSPVSPQHWSLGWSDQSVNEANRTLIPGAHGQIHLVSKGDTPEQVRFKTRTGDAPVVSFGEAESSADFRKYTCTVGCRLIRVNPRGHKTFEITIEFDGGLNLVGMSRRRSRTKEVLDRFKS